MGFVLKCIAPSEKLGGCPQCCATAQHNVRLPYAIVRSEQLLQNTPLSLYTRVRPRQEGGKLVILLKHSVKIDIVENFLLYVFVVNELIL